METAHVNVAQRPVRRGGGAVCFDKGLEGLDSIIAAGSARHFPGKVFELGWGDGHGPTRCYQDHISLYSSVER